MAGSGNNITGARDEYDYCGVVNIYNFKTNLFLVHIKNLEVNALYVGY